MSDLTSVTVPSPAKKAGKIPADVALRISQKIAAEIGCQPGQVNATVQLLDEGSTVPFIARYRKEVTGGLDDTQLRTLDERLIYMREMEDRRKAIVKSIDEQGKLSDELAKQISGADSKSALEDLYLPFRKKRRTKAQIAREAGLEPLSDLLLGNPNKAPESEAANFVDVEKGFADTKAVLDGARQILMERFSENAQLVGRLRGYVARKGAVNAGVVAGKEQDGAKFSDYFTYSENWKNIPSHRALALLRGRNEGVLALDLKVDEDDVSAVKPVERMISDAAGIVGKGRSADKWLSDVVRWTWKAKIGLHVELDLMGELRDRAEEEAIKVFARNLKDLLLAAPAGQHTTLGLDPGIRTGVKVAVVDATGKLVDTATIYPFQPRNDIQGSLVTLKALVAKHQVSLIAIGNGTASRETDRLAADLIKDIPTEFRPTKVMVNEAGASVYSASALAAKEMPDVDVSLRGAASIGRRLQDPLAELVKIEPKSIGVGQYQHDVNQTKLARSLDGVVEDAVNAVGVDLNTASAPLLSHISGLSDSLAKAVVDYRDTVGAFKNRRELLKVARLGPKAYEQCAGFLRISGGTNPLDASSVHPEAYPLAQKIIKACGRDIREIMGSNVLSNLDPKEFTDDKFGLPTVKDIFAELEKPGRDPRPEFKTATFQDGVETIRDLKSGMMLEGTVTNVTNFGAFVDIGVHQDGLVHVSQIADRFVDDPHTVVKAGDIVTVRVVEVDVARKRIGLTMRKDSADARENARESQADRGGQQQQQRGQGGRPGGGPNSGNRGGGSPRGGSGNSGASKPANSGDNNAMAAALAAAFNKPKR